MREKGADSAEAPKAPLSSGLKDDESWKLTQKGLAHVMPIVAGMSKVASVLKATQALTYYQGGHERHVMPDPNKVPEDPEGWKENVDYRLNMMRPNRLKAAYGRGPGWIVTKTGQGHGWDDIGTGRVVDSPLHRKTVDPFDDTPHFSTQSGKKFVSKTKWNPRKSGSQ